MFATKEYLLRQYDETGDSDGWEVHETVVLEGITFNGLDILQDDFDENDRLIYL